MIDNNFPDNEKDRKNLIQLINLYEKNREKLQEFLACLNYIPDMKNYVQHEDGDELRKFDISVEDLYDYEYLVS